MAGWHVEIMFINFSQNLCKFDKDISFQTIKFQRKTLKPESLPKILVTSGMSNQNVCIDSTHNLWKFVEDMCYQTQILFIFEILFSDIEQCFRPAQTKSKKSGLVKIILNKIRYF